MPELPDGFPCYYAERRRSCRCWHPRCRHPLRDLDVFRVPLSVSRGQDVLEVTMYGMQ